MNTINGRTYASSTVSWHFGAETKTEVGKWYYIWSDVIVAATILMTQ